MTNQLQAQQQKAVPMTLEQYSSGSPDYVYVNSIPQLQWLGDSYVFTKEGEIWQGNPATKGKEQSLLTQADLKRIFASEPDLSKMSKLPYWSAGRIGKLPCLVFYTRGEELYVDPAKQQVVARFARVAGAKDAVKNDQGTLSAVSLNHNVLIYPEGKGEPIVVTKDGRPDLVYGEAVHQNEFGIKNGLFWSPDGRKLAFYRMDQSMVKPATIFHVNERKQSHTDQYYPMAGMPIHHVSVGIYDVDTKQTTYLQTPDPSQTYLTNIAWSPDSKSLYIAEVNREQNEAKLKRYGLDGQLDKLLFTEQDKVYVEPQHPVQFVPGKSDQFVWISRRDGWMHCYLYNTSGKLLRQLTKGPWEMLNFLGFSADGSKIFVTTTEVSPLESNLYAVSLSNGKSKALTPAKGYHSPKISASGNYVLDYYESTEVARQINLLTSEGKPLRQLLDAPNPDKNYLCPKVELGTIKAADGKTDLHYRIIKPANLDPTKKYPAIVYVYNGPHAQLVHNRHRGDARGWDLHMANQGYIVFTVDGRGSANRGAVFEQVIHRQVGRHEMADQMKGVEFLKSLPYVDANRLGVYGWSYGGFMTTNLMLTHGDTFKVGVAGGAVMDWSRYEAMYGERYMDTPQENPKGYEGNNLLLRAKDLKGRLLLIHGTIDPVVLWQHTMLFVKSCVGVYTYPDYMIYPEHEHNVYGKDRVHLEYTITRYFLDHL